MAPGLSIKWLSQKGDPKFPIEGRRRMDFERLPTSPCYQEKGVSPTPVAGGTSSSQNKHTHPISMGTRNKNLLGAPGLTTRSKDATRGSWHRTSIRTSRTYAKGPMGPTGPMLGPKGPTKGPKGPPMGPGHFKGSPPGKGPMGPSWPGTFDGRMSQSVRRRTRHRIMLLRIIVVF